MKSITMHGNVNVKVVIINAHFFFARHTKNATHSKTETPVN